VRSSRLERRLLLGVLTLFLVPTVVAGAILLVLHRRGLLETPGALFTAVLIGLVAMMVYLGLTTRAIGQSLVRTVQEIQLGTELMAGINPGHRLAVRTGDELQALSEEINRLADRASEARTGLEREITVATRELTLERNTLSGVLAALGEGVVVATPDGGVTLANQAAQRLLGGPPLLGRRLWEFLDRAKLEHFVERGHLEGGAPQRFTLYGADGGLVETVLTPLTPAAGRLVGLILIVRDVTERVRLDDGRRDRLAADFLDLRSRLAAVRSLSESLLEEPTAGDRPARQLLEALHAEALRLSGLVTGMAKPERLGLAQAPSHYERLALGDLVAMTLRRLGPDAGVLAVDVAGDPHQLRAEASALSGTLALLARAVLDHRAPGVGAWLKARRRGRSLALDVGAEGDASQIDLNAVLQAGTPLGVPGAPRISEVVRQHAGEVWPYAEGGRFGFRMTLPEEAEALGPPASGGTRTRPGSRFVGAGLASGLAEGAPADERPDFYDFSLFETMERQVGPLDRERPLDELTYVVLDSETTGLDPARDQIVSIAGVVVRGRTVRRGEVFDALVNPGRPIPAMSARLHGISDAAVADCPPLDVVLPAFLDFAAGAVLVGHHVWFDLHILSREARSLRVEPALLEHPVLDTVALSQVVHGTLPNHGLEAVAARLGVIVRGRHSALGDALTTAEILIRLLPLLEKRGVQTLGQALAAARRARSVQPSEPGSSTGA
jgi:DNA polymerase-3 subunit epsilon